MRLLLVALMPFPLLRLRSLLLLSPRLGLALSMATKATITDANCARRRRRRRLRVLQEPPPYPSTTAYAATNVEPTLRHRMMKAPEALWERSRLPGRKWSRDGD